MALTRPTALQINTVVSAITDPLTILNEGATSANIDVGFIMNRGDASNVAFAWQESSGQFIVATTTSTGTINANVEISNYANIRAGHFEGDGSKLTRITADQIKLLSVKSTELVTLDVTNPTEVSDMVLIPSVSGSYMVTYSSQYSVQSLSSLTKEAASDLGTLYNLLMAAPATNTTHAPTFGSGEVLFPGVYTLAAATSIAGTLTLDALGDPNAVFVIRIGGAFTTAAGTTLILAGGATSNNIWWVSQGAASTGANTIFKGTMMTNQAGVSTGAACQVEGRLIAINGANAIAGTVFTVPTGTSTFPSGLVSIFSMFSGIGGVSNSGASKIALSVGSNSGAITGFESAEILGSIYYGSLVSATVAFGVYVDGLVIEDSIRTHTHLAVLNGTSVSLQTVISATAGQVINIKATAVIGTFTIGPGMSFVMLPVASY
jgi:hypothetical protein